MDALLAVGVLAGMGLFFAVMFFSIEEARFWPFEPAIRVKVTTDYQGAVCVTIKNRDRGTAYRALRPTDADFDTQLREAIAEARVVAAGMRDADKHARRRLPA
jgi:hypothetical protein